MLELSELRKSYGTSSILSGASLTCQRGEAVCILGANAAGKTTLLTIAAGGQAADAGTCRCDGKIGYIPQEPALLEGLSVKEHLALWYAVYDLPAKRMFTPDSPETLLGLRPFAQTGAKKLSGGMKKKLAIASALLANADYLLMDEPFAALDLASRTEVLQMLKNLTQQQKGILFVSHEPAEIAALANRALLLYGGKFVAELQLQGDFEQRHRQIKDLLFQV